MRLYWLRYLSSQVRRLITFSQGETSILSKSNGVSSLIIDMQRKALDSKERLDVVVSYALTVASKLGDEETQAWARSELNGYKTDVPDYRVIESRLRAWNPVRREWIRVSVDHPKAMSLFTTAIINMPLAEIVELSGVDDKQTIHMELDHHLYHQFFSGSEQHRMGMRPCQVIARNSLIGILGVVRSRVLDWSLELEKRGVKGTDFEFTPQEKHAAAKIVIQIGQLNAGNGQQVWAQNSSHVAVASDHSGVSINDPG